MNRKRQNLLPPVREPVHLEVQRLRGKIDIRPLHTEDDYRAALAEVSALLDQDPEPGTSEGDTLEILSILVEHYESLMETAHLLRSPANVAQLERFAAQLRAGKIKP
jgi:antitoxin component HigA of HigAB toxin-antitoxin module